MNLPDPRTALNALVTAVTALTLPASLDTLTPPAFAAVKLFDLRDLARAMEELFAYGNRIAIISLDQTALNAEVVARSVRVARGLQVDILISDRRFASRQTAMMGDAMTPGCLLLANILVNGLTGELPGGAIALPGNGELIDLREREDATGRIVYNQPFTLHDGWDATSLSRAAKIAATQ